MKKISLIVCTRNRATYLPSALDALSRMQTADPWELIVVNNASTDSTQHLLEQFAARNPSHVRLVQQPIRGLANAQNAGLAYATGDIFAFTDDDCYPEPDYLERIRACFDESPIQYLGGRVLLYDRRDAPVTIQTRETRVDLPPHCYIPAGIIHGAAFAFTREAMDALGGFDPTLGIGGALDSGNDINALIRCSAMGFRGAYDPRPVVYHHHRRRSEDDVERLLKRYDVSRGAAYYMGISNASTRRAYAWPVLRRVASNLLKGHWGTLQRELSGGYRFARILRGRSAGH
ncbi:MAG: glycosyltransferase family 2 protein [Betaproteobacteria bacterium]